MCYSKECCIPVKSQHFAQVMVQVPKRLLQAISYDLLTTYDYLTIAHLVGIHTKHNCPHNPLTNRHHFTMAFTSADTETSCGKKTVVPNPFTNRHGITMSSCSKKSVVLSILCILFFPAIIYLGPFLVGPYVYFMWLMERDLKNMYLAEGISTFVGLYSGTMDKHQRLQPHIISHQSVVRSPRWWNVYQEIHSDTI